MPLLSGLLSTGLPLAVLLAVTGTILLAVGTHVQQREVLRLVPHGGTPGPRLLLTAPLWLLGGALIGLKTVANVAALGLAPVAIIQIGRASCRERV